MFRYNQFSSLRSLNCLLKRTRWLDSIKTRKNERITTCAFRSLLVSALDRARRQTGWGGQGWLGKSRTTPSGKADNREEQKGKLGIRSNSACHKAGPTASCQMAVLRIVLQTSE